MEEQEEKKLTKRSCNQHSNFEHGIRVLLDLLLCEKGHRQVVPAELSRWKPASDYSPRPQLSSSSLHAGPTRLTRMKFKTAAPALVGSRHFSVDDIINVLVYWNCDGKQLEKRLESKRFACKQELSNTCVEENHSSNFSPFLRFYVLRSNWGSV